MSVTDPQHMPPRCCTQDHIPLKHVDRLFDTKFKMKWNKKYQEYTTKNRIYCPAKGCGEWIKPSHIHTDPNNGRKYGRCGRCKLKVCCKCNGKWHSGKDCPKDEDTKRFVEIAKKEGWQRCFNCSAMVELKEGCNHMTCRCTAEFCMICGLKWKTCSCPWFNYEAVENDRLNHMNIPEARRVLAEAGRNNVPRAYHEELGRRRDQERLDEAFARRLVLGLDGDGEDLDNGNEVDDDDGDGNSHTETGNQGAFFEAGNTAGHFLNQDFVRRTTHVLGRNIGQIANAAEDLVAEHYHHLGVQGPDGSPVRERRHHAYGPPSRGRVSDASQLSPLVRTYSAARASDRNATRRTDTAPATAMDYLTEDAGTAGHQRAHDRDRDRRRPSAMAGLTARTPSGRIGSWLDHIDIDDGDGGRRVIPVR
ncbi:hypothetical protein MMC16_004523 [Acarospora aff. strigata]|nr:hypothetical protein [Acarospora aff. strigata]